jgi:hypothetical protein
VTNHKSFGKTLVRFQPGCFSAGAEDTLAGGFKQIDNPRRKNVIRPHDGEVDRLPSREIQQLIQFRDFDVDVPAELSGPRIPGRDKNLFDSRRLTKLPGKRVFAAATADHQNVHEEFFTAWTA